MSNSIRIFNGPPFLKKKKSKPKISRSQGGWTLINKLKSLRYCKGKFNLIPVAQLRYFITFPQISGRSFFYLRKIILMDYPACCKTSSAHTPQPLFSPPPNPWTLGPRQGWGGLGHPPPVNFGKGVVHVILMTKPTPFLFGKKLKSAQSRPFLGQLSALLAVNHPKICQKTKSEPILGTPILTPGPIAFVGWG